MAVIVGGFSGIYLGALPGVALATSSTTPSENAYFSTSESIEEAITASALTKAQARSQGRGTGRRGVRR